MMSNHAEANFRGTTATYSGQAPSSRVHETRQCVDACT